MFDHQSSTAFFGTSASSVRGAGAGAMLRIMSRVGATLFAILLIIPAWNLSAQTLTEEDEADEIRMIARSSVDSVQLRWAPSNYRIWKLSQEAGLHLTRQTLMRNAKMLPDAERAVITRLTAAPIKPAPEAQFGALASNNRHVAIGGQAIYGASFNPTSSDAGDSELGGILNLAREQNNRFGMGLFAADQDWTAARMMGLAFTDKTARANEVYLYRLVPAAPIARYDTLESGFLTVVTNNNAPPPAVQDFAVDFADRQATLNWDIGVARNYYSSYFVERSTDGVSWQSVNQDGQGFVPLLREGQAPVTYFQDSLPLNNRPYFYRVKGKTPFGEIGPASIIEQGMGLDPQPNASPTLSSLFSTEEGGIIVSWAFASEQPINGFRVERAIRDEGPYEDISGLLPADERIFTDEAPLISNYYRVTVYDQYDRSLTSYSALGQPEDETPPAIPSGLRGIILKDGRVIISWDENTEPDLLGYRIWLSNQPEVEYTLATGAPIKENYFAGKTTLKTLTSKLYAKIVALDLRHNTSDFSDYIELTRPDTIPPTAPLLRNLVADQGQLALDWAYSMSLDVAQHTLQRRVLSGADTSWATIATFPAPLSGETDTYTDTDIPVGELYGYRLVATDGSGLSATSNVLKGNIIDDFIRKPIDKASATADRRAQAVDLRWEYVPEKDDFNRFEVYRSEADGPARSIAVVDPAAAATRRKGFQFQDAGPLKMNTRYVYRLRAIYADGGRSPLSPPVAVDY